jgi:twitching motility protein PilT
MAIEARATDLHLVAGRPVRVRVATELQPRTQPMLAGHVERIAREIVPPRLRETLERDGACELVIERPGLGRFRVHVMRQRTGYKLGIRLLPRELPTLSSLGLPESVASAAAYTCGLVLVTGPCGHGKTSTLAAIVDVINRDSARRIITIEDPIEIVHPGKRAMLSQREVGAHVRSCTAGVASALREDADVVVIGELRDAESARVAFDAAESGRLVLATMIAASPGRAFEHLAGFFPPAAAKEVRARVARVLRLIVGQRLVAGADRARLHAEVELLSVLTPDVALEGHGRDTLTLQQDG